MLGPRAITKSPSWSHETRLVVFSGYTTWWQRRAAHKTPYLNMGDAEEAPEVVHPNQAKILFRSRPNSTEPASKTKPTCGQNGLDA